MSAASPALPWTCTTWSRCLSDHPLLALDNVLLTPHLGYATLDSLAAFYRYSVDNIKAWAAGEPMNVLNADSLTEVRR